MSHRPQEVGLIVAFPCVQVLDMNQKMEDILKILVEHFKPKPELLQKPVHYSSRVTVMKHMGVSMDEGH